jgi:hypothetical protein
MTDFKTDNKALEWFIKEGALTQQNNVYVGPRVFVANSIINWVKTESSTLKQEEIEYIMKTVRLFLQNQLELKWADGKIEIVSTTSADSEPLFKEL